MDVYIAAERTAKEMSSVDGKCEVVVLLSIDDIDRYAWEEPPEVEFSTKAQPQNVVRKRGSLKLVKC